MNFIESLHPILVHFPIALLTVYAILECVRFKKILEHHSIFYVKAFLTVVGFFAAIAAFSTGPEGSAVNSWSGYAGMTGSNGRPIVHQIVDMHSNFATLTLIVFGIIAFSYLVVWIQRHYAPHYKIWDFFVSVACFIQKPSINIILAILGLVLVTVTGSLGGSIVYGPNVDPIVSFVYHLFF